MKSGFVVFYVAVGSINYAAVTILQKDTYVASVSDLFYAVPKRSNKQFNTAITNPGVFINCFANLITFAF